MLIFNLDADGAFASSLAADLDVALAACEDRAFDDGEHKLRPLVDPRGEDVYVVQSLHGGPIESPHDKLCRLLMFVATLRDHGAARVSAVVPYLAYARKDRRTKPFDPVNQRYIAQLFEAVGTAQLFVLEAHNVAALENAFRCQVVHLEAHRAFDTAVDLIARQDAGTPLVVASPDPGGVKRAQLWREELEASSRHPVGFAMVDKRRSAGVMSSQEIVAGNVTQAVVLLIDDLIATGGTLVHAARALRSEGASKVIAFAAHGLFVGNACDTLADNSIEQIVVTDSVPSFRVADRTELRRKLKTVSCVRLFGQAIRESHSSFTR